MSLPQGAALPVLAAGGGDCAAFLLEPAHGCPHPTGTTNSTSISSNHHPPLSPVVLLLLLWCAPPFLPLAGLPLSTPRPLGCVVGSQGLLGGQSLRS